MGGNVGEGLMDRIMRVNIWVRPCVTKSPFIGSSRVRNGKKGEREREKKEKNQNVEKGKPGEEEEAYQSIIHTSHIQRQKGKGLSSCETPTQ